MGIQKALWALAHHLLRVLWEDHEEQGRLCETGKHAVFHRYYPASRQRTANIGHRGDYRYWPVPLWGHSKGGLAS
jgi:hypothetical protein